MLVSFVFPQFTSFHSVFHSFHGLVNSINWPASSLWVFIAQLGEHCSANAEATGSNPVEAPRKPFFGLFSQLLKLRFTAMVTRSFHLCSRSSHHFIQCFVKLMAKFCQIAVFVVGCISGHKWNAQVGTFT